MHVYVIHYAHVVLSRDILCCWVGGMAFSLLEKLQICQVLKFTYIYTLPSPQANKLKLF